MFKSILINIKMDSLNISNINSPESQFIIGKYYYDQRKYKLAISYFTNAGNYPGALAYIGLCHETKDFKYNYAKAIEYFRKAAEQNCPHGQNYLAWCYYNGKGIIQDTHKAVEYWEKSAAQGFAQSMLMLGECYSHGTGVEKNDKVAREWYSKWKIQSKKDDPSFHVLEGHGVLE